MNDCLTLGELERALRDITVDELMLILVANEDEQGFVADDGAACIADLIYSTVIANRDFDNAGY